jgi:hypothetical protein
MWKNPNVGCQEKAKFRRKLAKIANKCVMVQKLNAGSGIQPMSGRQPEVRTGALGRRPSRRRLCRRVRDRKAAAQAGVRMKQCVQICLLRCEMFYLINLQKYLLMCLHIWFIK